MADRTYGTRRLAGWLVALVTVIAAVLGGAQPAAAEEIPPPPPEGSGEGHNRWTNGCTGVPDAAFTIACNEHDLCYGGRIADPSDPSRPASRGWCDNRFYEAMGLTCIGSFDLFDARLGPCFGMAGLYYLGVRTFGVAFYDPFHPYPE
jgi:hypothetical protein